MATDEKPEAGLLKTLDDIEDHEDTRLEYIETIKDKLKTVFDPELPIDIYQLGLAVESIPGIKKCHTRITMTPPWTQESIDPQVRELLFGF